MDFDEWFDDAIWGNEDFKTCLQRAWEAATEAEREACAKVCEAQAILQDDAFRHGMTPVDGDLADRCATGIRRRSNAQGNGLAATNRTKETK